MSLWKNSVSNEVTLPRGGYLRGALSATAVSSVAFIIYNTAFPVNPFPVVANDTIATAATAEPIVEAIDEPRLNTIANLPNPSTSLTSPSAPSLGAGAATVAALGGGPVAAENGAVSGVVVGDTTTISSPTIRTPNLGTTSSGVPLIANRTSQGGAPTLPGSVGVTLLGESQTNGQTNLASIDVNTSRPTANVVATSPTILAPNADGAAQLRNQTTQVASLNATQNSLPPIAPALDGAFAKHAQLFTDTGSRTLVSIVLHVDSLEQAVASAGLAASVTLAVDAENPAAAQIVSAYNDFGGESLLSMPTTGNLQLSANDSPDAIEDKLKLMVPDELRVIGVMDTSGTAVPDTPETVDAVLRVLAPWGHAIVSPGVNQAHGAQGLANQVGLPATSFVSALSSVGDHDAIVREMNRVASSTDASGAVVVFGEADADTLAALNTWLTSSNAGTVTMAPVSAAILRN